MAVTRLKYWPTLYSMVMPIPPCSWIAPWPTMRPERPICTLAAEIALRRSLASGSATIIVASIAMLQHLEAADRHAELFARAQIVEGQFVHRRHGAHRLGAERRHGFVGNALDHRVGGARLPEHGVGAGLHVGERHVGGTHAVDGRIVAVGDAGRASVDDEEGEAVAIAPVA